jgi:ureidoglycolate hydrolase
VRISPRPIGRIGTSASPQARIGDNDENVIARVGERRERGSYHERMSRIAVWTASWTSTIISSGAGTSSCAHDLQRHPLGSQLFLPLGFARFVIVVATAGRSDGPDDIFAFVTDGRQGVNYRIGVWHHPLLAIEQQADFLVIDR